MRSVRSAGSMSESASMPVANSWTVKVLTVVSSDRRSSSAAWLSATVPPAFVPITSSAGSLCGITLSTLSGVTMEPVPVCEATSVRRSIDCAVSCVEYSVESSSGPGSTVTIHAASSAASSASARLTISLATSGSKPRIIAEATFAMAAPGTSATVGSYRPPNGCVSSANTAKVPSAASSCPNSHSKNHAYK